MRLTAKDLRHMADKLAFDLREAERCSTSVAPSERQVFLDRIKSLEARLASVLEDLDEFDRERW